MFCPFREIENPSVHVLGKMFIESIFFISASHLFFVFHRKNRTHLRDNMYAIGTLKEGHLTPDMEDEVLISLGIENFSSVKMLSRLQVGDKIIHSLRYKRVTRRNSFTVAYREGPNVKYGQIETFFTAPKESIMPYGAVVLPMSESKNQLCKQHQVLGILDGHIAPLNQLNQSISCAAVISLEDIIDVCVFIKFSDSPLCYAAHFANRIEKD